MNRVLRGLALAIPALAGAAAIAVWWTWNAIEDGIRHAMRANRYRIRRGARLL